MVATAQQSVERLDPRTVFQKVESGQALLVCAYDDDVKFKGVALEGALPLSEFRLLEPKLARDQALIFY